MSIRCVARVFRNLIARIGLESQSAIRSALNDSMIQFITSATCSSSSADCETPGTSIRYSPASRHADKICSAAKWRRRPRDSFAVRPMASPAIQHVEMLGRLCRRDHGMTRGRKISSAATLAMFRHLIASASSAVDASEAVHQ